MKAELIETAVLVVSSVSYISSRRKWFSNACRFTVDYCFLAIHVIFSDKANLSLRVSMRIFVHVTQFDFLVLRSFVATSCVCLMQMHRRLHLFIREPVGHNDSDSTSGCSADMSNADSGRGPSEDGEYSRNGGKCHRLSHAGGNGFPCFCVAIKII